MTGAALADMHCHLDRMSNAAEVARDALRQGMAILDVTVTPQDALRARELLGGMPNVRVGAGLHPWWVADGSCGREDAALAAELAAESPFIGEVGLDFSRRCEGTFDEQAAALDAVARAAAGGAGPRVISLHAVRSAGAVLDILERHGLVGPAGAERGVACVMHWFSGTSGELARARRLGCMFSVSEHMLRSKRGREYARVIERGRLLLETDAPPGLDAPWSAREVASSLERALGGIAAARREDAADLGAEIARSSARLLGFGAPRAGAGV